MPVPINNTIAAMIINPSYQVSSTFHRILSEWKNDAMHRNMLNKNPQTPTNTQPTRSGIWDPSSPNKVSRTGKPPVSGKPTNEAMARAIADARMGNRVPIPLIPSMVGGISLLRNTDIQR